MNWYPQPKQETFLKLSWFEVLFGGTKGPGKTDALLAESTRQLHNPNYRGIIFRRTFPKLQELIDRSMRWFAGKAHWNGEIHRWTWSNKAFIQFGHCKNEADKYNYQGHEYSFMGFDQLEEFTESQYDFLKAQCRTTDPTLICYVRSTANPGNVGHAWVKSRFIDKLTNDGTPKYFKRVGEDDVETTEDDPQAMSRAFLYANIYDNPILMKNDPNYIRILDNLPPKLRKALKEGDWDIFEGQFFLDWKRSIHVRNSFDRSIPHTKFMAFDYGYTKPASLGWYAVMPEGLLIRYREIYKEGLTYEEWGKLIILANEKTGEFDIKYMTADPAIWGDKQHHKKHISPKIGEAKGESGYQIMQKVIGNRFPIIKADNRRMVGWVRVREYIRPYVDQNGKVTAKFLVTANCRNFIRTIPGMIHDEHNPEDLDTTGEDHAADEVRYAIMSRQEMPVLPPKVITPTQEFWARVKGDIKKRQFAGREDEVEHSIVGEGERIL